MTHPNMKTEDGDLQKKEEAQAIIEAFQKRLQAIKNERIGYQRVTLEVAPPPPVAEPIVVASQEPEAPPSKEELSEKVIRAMANHLQSGALSPLLRGLVDDITQTTRKKFGS